MKHGIQDPSSTTAYSYCSAGGGEGMDFATYERCIPCIAADGTKDFLANCRFLLFWQVEDYDADLSQTLWLLKPAAANSLPRECSSA